MELHRINQQPSSLQLGVVDATRLVAPAFGEALFKTVGLAGYVASRPAPLSLQVDLSDEGAVAAGCLLASLEHTVRIEAGRKRKGVR